MSKKKSGNPKKAKASRTKVQTAPKSSTNRTTLILLGLILALFCFLIYTNTLSHDYALDDYSAIKENRITKKGFDGLYEIFTKHYRFGYWNSPGTLYRPVSLAMFAVEWDIAEDKPGFYHFMNVLLYAFTAFLLFWTLIKLLPDKGPLLPFLATFIYICHPIHVEVVANIKSRDEILAFLFCIGAIYCFWKYLKFDKIKWLGLAFFSYLIAMFSKESAVTFLAIFPLIAYFFLKKNLGESLAQSSIFIAPVALYLFARYQVLGSFIGGSKKETIINNLVDDPFIKNAPLLDNVIADSSNYLEQFATAMVFAGKYLKNLVFPYPLGSDFGYPEYTAMGFDDWRAILSLLVFLALAYYALRLFKSRNLISFSILYFLITFSIASNIIIVIGTSYGDRFMYVPSLGFSIAIAYLISHFTKVDYKQKIENLSAFFSKFKKPIAIAGIIILVFGVLTIKRNGAWENSYALYHADIEVAPNSAKLNYHYGLELNKKGLAATDPADKKVFFESAMFRFNKAAELYPKYGDAYGQIGLLFFRIKDFPNAIANYQTAISYKPNAAIYSNLGTVYFETGKVSQAIEAYQKSIKYDPYFVDARRNLGSSYAMNKQFDRALLEYKEALKYDPKNAILHYYIGVVYRDLGDQVNAQTWLNKAYALDPSLKK